jgi:3',5'-cyclic AMP phosphodiesterase CpdA
MQPLKIAIVSDLHIGLGAISKSLCPEPNKKNKVDLSEFRSKFDVDYIEIFSDFIKKHPITYDYLFILGDITDSGKPEEIDFASKLIVNLSEILNIPLRKVIFIPGNHDVDWSILEDQDRTGVKWSQRYLSFLHDKFCFKDIVRNGVGNILEEPYFSIFSYDDIFIVGYNSAHHDDPHRDHFGLITQKHLDEISKAIEAATVPEDKLKIFLLHHHPFSYDEPVPDDYDRSLLQNSEQLESLLFANNFDMIIHGHKHLPRFKTISIDNEKPIASLCAGSFAKKMSSSWAGAITNQFHIVEIEGRENLIIHGTIWSWGYTRIRGWEKSTKRQAGIEHCEPFGLYLIPGTLEAILEPLIKARLSEKGFAEWSYISNIDTQLKRLRPKQFLRVLDKIAAANGCRRRYEDIENIILLKE